ncbi:MAG: hypothetical protein ACLRMI_00665 [Streptococcus sp.]
MLAHQSGLKSKFHVVSRSHHHVPNAHNPHLHHFHALQEINGFIIGDPFEWFSNVTLYRSRFPKLEHGQKHLEAKLT